MFWLRNKKKYIPVRTLIWKPVYRFFTLPYFTFSLLFIPEKAPVIFLPARPGSQTHASHKGRMILNHESPAGCIKIVAKSLHLVFATFVLSAFF